MSRVNQTRDRRRAAIRRNERERTALDPNRLPRHRGWRRQLDLDVNRLVVRAGGQSTCKRPKGMLTPEEHVIFRGGHPYIGMWD